MEQHRELHAQRGAAVTNLLPNPQTYTSSAIKTEKRDKCGDKKNIFQKLHHCLQVLSLWDLMATATALFKSAHKKDSVTGPAASSLHKSHSSTDPNSTQTETGNWNCVKGQSVAASQELYIRWLSSTHRNSSPPNPSRHSSSKSCQPRPGKIRLLYFLSSNDPGPKNIY